MKRITRGLIALALSSMFTLGAGVLVGDRAPGATSTTGDGWIVAGVADDGWIVTNEADTDPPIVVQGGG